LEKEIYFFYGSLDTEACKAVIAQWLKAFTTVGKRAILDKRQ
jgi:hypothetical protein